MAFLKVFSNDEERTVFLGDTAILFGRGQEADVMLQDLKVSRLHCEVVPTGEFEWSVRDMGSGNGTKVNGVTVVEHALEPDDVIEIGSAKIVFAGEGVSVVRDAEPAREAPPRRPRSERVRARSGSSAKPMIITASILLAAAAVLLFFWGGDPKGDGYGKEARLAHRAVKNARSDAELVELGKTFLDRYPDAANSDEVAGLVAAARQRLRDGTSAQKHGYDPTKELEGLTPLQSVKRLEELLVAATPEQRPAVRAALADYRMRLQAVRAAFFKDLETVFLRHIEKGEFRNAREIWFFLRGEPDWVPIPESYVSRIVDANKELENAASAARTALFDEVSQAESAHDFKRAHGIVSAALPQFEGTSVARSLRERLDFLQRAMIEGVEGQPTAAKTVVRVDVRKKIGPLLDLLKRREFAAAADGLRALAKSVRKEQGWKEVDARARECEAAAALNAAIVKALASADLPKKQIARRWRVTGGGKDGVRVRIKGAETEFPWAEAPVDLYLGLLQWRADKVDGGALGLVVVAHAVAGEQAMVPLLAKAYENTRRHGALDAFVAHRRNEPLPEGGYVVHDGAILTRKEFHRKREEELIARLNAQLSKAYATILADKTATRLARLKAKKDKLDETRVFALELIFDERKYFYPYRGTGRMGEYTKVQREVDDRVAKVREIWEDKASVSIKASSDMQRALSLFDEAAEQLEKLLVDHDEEVEHVTFLRSYFGGKFNVRSFYRTPEEKDLLDYSVEVMAFNTTVEGKISDVEREQVRVTNEYRKMFGRWPVRLEEKLVLSSRGHCAEMSEVGYFGHFSPTPGRRTPYDRMKLAGYQWGSSENIIAGRTGPKAAHDGWCHSSGHHRNILMAPWTEMGTGHLGRMMTQNYGSRPKYSERDPKPEEQDDPYGDYDECGCGCGCGCGDTEFDYGDEDEDEDGK